MRPNLVVPTMSCCPMPDRLRVLCPVVLWGISSNRSGGHDKNGRRIVVDFRPQKKIPNRVCITAGGNLIAHPDELTTRTADITCSKILWNSVLSTKDTKYSTLGIANFYLGTPLERYKYTKMPIEMFPPHIKERYQLDEKVYKGYVWLEICKAIYGLPQAEILANKQLRKKN